MSNNTTKYLVWCPFWGDEENAYVVEQPYGDEEYAAVRFAEDHFDEPFEEIDVIVKDTTTGTKFKVNITVDYSPNFYAHATNFVED